MINPSTIIIIIIIIIITITSIRSDEKSGRTAGTLSNDFEGDAASGSKRAAKSVSYEDIATRAENSGHAVRL